MTVLLLAAALFAAPPDTSLAALYGAWETSDGASRTDVVGGVQITSVTLYRALDLTAGSLTTTSIGSATADRTGVSGGVYASESRAPYRAEGLTLAFPDSLRARLRPDGDRLGVTWTRADSVLAEVLYARAVRPHPFAGRWGVTAVDEAGVPAFVPLTVAADGRVTSPGEASLADARIAGGFLVHRCEHVRDGPGDARVLSCRASRLREEGHRVVIEEEGRTWMARL